MTYVRGNGISVLIRRPLKFCDVRMSSSNEFVLDVLPTLVDGESISSHRLEFNKTVPEEAIADNLLR
eukprot:CAMPEP_0114433596 /NCGR_PEP_ID=MMETSP0103-20121206/11775_1 /TAXON_ID=37642 ORGANISM="Paraphysomonas imperforata, Strain PA2" /NCGR_SAMPLE_ID=MMETSP0103 /ASSEMBLY_ACC=CAM_ASM_000201 /LENGTH=66 /DNA_ID=CAMNT_0001603353 /DNA_START=398 /DNA_END=598 /DNA_ORIENTATION=+